MDVTPRRRKVLFYTDSDEEDSLIDIVVNPQQIVIIQSQSFPDCPSDSQIDEDYKDLSQTSSNSKLNEFLLDIEEEEISN